MPDPRTPLALVVASFALSCDGGDTASDTSSSTTTSDAQTGADTSAPTGAWRVLGGGDHAGLGTRLHGAARHDGALYVAMHAGRDDRVDVVRLEDDGARAVVDMPFKIQNTANPRLVSTGDDLFMLVPYFAGGNRIGVYRLDGAAFVELADASTTARTLADLVLVAAGTTIAAAWFEGDGPVVVARRDPDTDSWTPVGGGPAATPALGSGELSLDHEDGRFLVAYSENEDQQAFATVRGFDGDAWTTLGEPRLDGSLGFFDVALSDGEAYFLRSVPEHRVLRWTGSAWEVAYEGEPGEQLFDLRSDGGDLYWVAHGGTHGAGHVVRMREGRVDHFPNRTEAGAVLLVAPLTTFPRREIVADGGALSYVYEDIGGNVWKVWSTLWVP
ncbi:MAG: hypothetical protein IT385_30475 [Deltaproteobacteria bacterium]|nr:hypothetical protein [Deltaproteobacteria bacterium]